MYETCPLCTGGRGGRRAASSARLFSSRVASSASSSSVICAQNAEVVSRRSPRSDSVPRVASVISAELVSAACRRLECSAELRDASSARPACERDAACPISTG